MLHTSTFVSCIYLFYVAFIKCLAVTGIFQSHIQYLLVLATPVDIVLLGASFTHTNAGITLFLMLVCRWLNVEGS